jgi:hypothetical protein
MMHSITAISVILVYHGVKACWSTKSKTLREANERPTTTPIPVDDENTPIRRRSSIDNEYGPLNTDDPNDQSKIGSKRDNEEGARESTEED